MEHLQHQAKGERTTYKCVAQIFIILIAEIIVFIVTYKQCLKNVADVNKNHSTLILVQILFRHGERTPLTGKSYPNDPYINYTYEPYGPESLTYTGEKTMYQLGKFLREYYSGFLGEYHQDIVYSQTSPISRCKNSLSLVLASLFPPRKERPLLPHLKWQPIEYYYNPYETDNIFYNIFNCGKFLKLRLAESKRTLEIKTAENNSEIVRYLEFHTGMKLETAFDILRLYDFLIVQSELGLKLPKWTETIFPNLIESYALLEIGVTSRTDTLKRLSGGFLLKEMIHALDYKLQNNSQSKKRKIHLYSGHDYTFFSLLGTLGIVLRERPLYGCFISLELHKLHNTLGIKVVFHNYKSETPTVVKLPECEEFCPIESFLKLYKKYEATPDMC